MWLQVIGCLRASPSHAVSTAISALGCGPHTGHAHESIGPGSIRAAASGLRDRGQLRRQLLTRRRVCDAPKGGDRERTSAAFSEGSLAVGTESATTFSRTFIGYKPAAVDKHVDVLTTKQQLLLVDVESLRARLKQCGDEAAAMRKEIAVLRDTSPSPHAMQYRTANIMRRAVDEISAMHDEARAEADALIAAAKAKAEAEQQEHEALLAQLTERREALDADYTEAKEKLDAELAMMRAETQSQLEEAWKDAQQEREQLLADAKQEADFYREQAQQAREEASQQRLNILEQLMDVYRHLEAAPAAL